jgi:integrase
MARRGPLPSNILRRGNSYVVHMRGMRDDGGDFWRKFADAEYGGKEGSFAEADLCLSLLREKKARGQRMAPKVLATFREASEAWYRHGITQENWRPSTAADYRSALDSRLLPEFGDTKLSEVTEAHIAEWLTRARAEGLSPRTLQKLLTIMVGVFKRAHRVYKFSGNPAAEVERIKQADRPELQVFEPDEVWALHDAAESEQDAALFLTAAFTGLRLGELIALRIRNVDEKRSVIHVEKSFTRGKETAPKSGKGRPVPMVEDVSQELAKFLLTRGNPRDDELVFPGPDGKHLNGDALRDRYVAARNAAGLRPLTFHRLRHSFGSVAIDKLSAVEVQHAMGHAQLTTTQRYLHYRDGRDLANRLQGAFARTPISTEEPVSSEQLANVLSRCSDEQLDEALRLIASRREGVS